MCQTMMANTASVAFQAVGATLAAGTATPGNSRVVAMGFHRTKPVTPMTIVPQITAQYSSFLLKRIIVLHGPLFTQPQVVAHRLDAIAHILEAGQHAHRRAQDKDPIAQVPQVIDRLQHQHNGRDAMQNADSLDPAQQAPPGTGPNPYRRRSGSSP